MKKEVSIYNLIWKYVLLTNVRAVWIFTVVYLIVNAFIWFIKNAEMVAEFVSNHWWLVTFIVIYIICIMWNMIDFYDELEERKHKW